MISKNDANKIATDYLQDFPTRLDNAITAAARGGVVGCTVFYGAVPHNFIVGLITKLQNANWNVVDDQVNYTLTLS